MAPDSAANSGTCLRAVPSVYTKSKGKDVNMSQSQSFTLIALRQLFLHSLTQFSSLINLY